MHAHGKHRNGDALPALITVIVAVLGVTGILLSDFGPGNGSQGGDKARMITAAAVSRAGAIETPSDPTANRSAS
jgi:hypothetical protein